MELNLKEKSEQRTCAKHPNTPRYALPPHRCIECTRHRRRVDYDRKGSSGLDKYYGCLYRAKLKGHVFTLTQKEHAELISRPCAYALRFDPTIRIGIDRKDSSAGYFMENCAPCCYRHNQMKSNIMSYENMLDAAVRYQIECGNSTGGHKKLGASREIDWKVRVRKEPKTESHTVPKATKSGLSPFPKESKPKLSPTRKTKRKRYVPVPSGLDLAGRQEYMRQRHNRAV